MRFRKWMKMYKNTRQEAVPDVSGALKEACEQAKAPVKVFTFRPWQRIAALAASVAIVVGIGGYFGFRYLTPDIPTITPETTETSATDNTSNNTTTTVPSTAPTKGPDTPDRPATGVLGVSLNRYIPMSLIGAVDKYMTAHTVRLRADQLDNEHKDCLGVYYDTKTQKIVCPQHTLEEKLSKMGITTRPYIHAFHPSYNTAVFTLIDGDKSSYFYDVDTDTLKKLSVSLYQCHGNAEVQSGTPYVVFWRGGGNNDIYAMQMKTGELINILQDKNGKYLGTPMDDARLSVCGKYAIYTLGEGNDPNGPGRTTVFYTFATRQIRKFTGELCEEIPTMNCFLLNTPSGYAKYDIATGKTTPLTSSDIPKQYYTYLQKEETELTYECYRLVLCDRVTGTKTALCEEFVYAHGFSPDRRYLCYYIRGEESVRVMDLQNGTSGTIAFDVPPTEQTESEELTNRALLFSIAFEGENELILLYATNGNHRLDPYEALAYKQSFPGYWIDEMEQEETLTSIASLEWVLRKFKKNLTAYEGDGFIYLDYSPLTPTDYYSGSLNPRLLLEDYESGSAYRVYHKWHDFESEFSGLRLGNLPASAQTATRMLLEELGIPIQPAHRDYRPYLSGDATAVMQLHLKDISASALENSLNCFCVRARNDGYEGARMYLESPTEKAEFLEFLAFTDTLNYRIEKDMSPYRYFYYFYSVDVNYANNANSFEIYVGNYYDKYYLFKKDYVATITAEQYAKWQPWLEAKSKEGHLD